MATTDLISTTVVSGSSTNIVSLTSIPQGYTDLLLLAICKSTDTSNTYDDLDNEAILYDTGGAVMPIGGAWMGQIAASGGIVETSQFASGYNKIAMKTSNESSGGIGVQVITMRFLDYSSTTVAKNVHTWEGKTSSTNTSGTMSKMHTGCFNGASSNLALGRIDFVLGSSKYFKADSTFSLYGINS